MTSTVTRGRASTRDLLCLLFLLGTATSAHSQTHDGMPKMDTSSQQHDSMQSMASQKSEMAMDATEMDVAHPFFTHMGMPEGVGNYALRLVGVATRDAGETDGDFGFHLETGLSKTIGLHVRNDRVSTNTHTEVMLQFAAISSRDGMSGVSPLIEFEFPTHEGEKTIYTLVGFTTAWSTSKFALNQSLEYSPKEEVVEGSAAAVVRVGGRFFPTVEMIGEAAKGALPLYAALGGIKARIGKHVFAGVAYKAPISDERDFDSQLLIETDLEM